MAKKILPVIMILLAAVMLFSIGMIFRESYNLMKDQSSFDELTKIISDISTSPEPEHNTETASEAEQPKRKRNLNPLFEQNEECIGWICIPNTTVDYPVMYTPLEPQKYLRKNFSGEYSSSGIPFLAGNSTPDSDNLIIYGHNMKNGTMFSDITKYRNIEFYEENPCIEWETESGLKNYNVFAVICLKNTDEWYKFISAENEEHFQNAITEIKNRSLYDIAICPQYGQQLITLSTCYGNNKNDRIIVIGAEKEG